MDIILQSGETLMEITNDVLDLASPESGRMELENAPVDIRQLLKSTIAASEFEAMKKQLKVSSNFSADIPKHILTDATRLKQIFLNLVGNAIKFTRHGEVRVELDLAFKRIRIRVIDTVIGISKLTQATLFEPFVQADFSSSRKRGGSGLGLAIVKRLVTAMDGKIMVNSVPLDCSTFTVFLSFKSSSVPAVKSAEDSQHTLPPLKILLADDNAVNRMVLSRLLENDGYDVIPVSTGRDVVDYIASNEIDIILMDLQMPGMDGIEATRRIRAFGGKSASIPVIAISTIVNRDNADQVLAAGMNDYITKPFRHEELITVIQKSLPGNLKYQRDS